MIHPVHCEEDDKRHAQLTSTPRNINRETEIVSVKTQTLILETEKNVMQYRRRITKDDNTIAHLNSTNKSRKGENFDSAKPIVQYRRRVKATITLNEGHNYFENIPDEILMIILKKLMNGLVELFVLGLGCGGPRIMDVVDQESYAEASLEDWKSSYESCTGSIHALFNYIFCSFDNKYVIADVIRSQNLYFLTERAQPTQLEEQSRDQQLSIPMENTGLPRSFNLESYTKFMKVLQKFPFDMAPENAIQRVFDSLHSPDDMIRENSIHCQDVPVPYRYLTLMFLNMDVWTSSLSPSVRLVSFDVPEQLIRIFDNTIQISLINAGFQLPTPLVPRRNFEFYRFFKVVDAHVSVIFDISTAYFLHSSDGSVGKNLWRRQSAVIVYQLDEVSSKVFWAENVHRPSLNLQTNIYTDLMNSKMMFSAKHLVNTLLWRYNRRKSKVTLSVWQEDGLFKVQNLLLLFTEKMKMAFLDIVSAPVDDKKWVILVNGDIRVMRNRIDVHNIPGTVSCIAVSTFRLEAAPLKAYNFLIKHLQKIQFPWGRGYSTQEVIRFESESNHIMLLQGIYPEEFTPRNSPHFNAYLLQEASSDEFCRFVVGALMTEVDGFINLSLCMETDLKLNPAGFAILPDGINPYSSLVTIVVRETLKVSDDICRKMEDSIKRSIGGIRTTMKCNSLLLKGKKILSLSSEAFRF
ncbi:hypothetical protein POM88_032706 [Heracleum sosnowskyi]|uniref:Uncharacterized protein n=1 Tax=Heracleum sosnowskyi TaxID=360622 RepID=A0AAD8I243_9APIA|nr:hypothetical protein POM88_032706 [Heracleum sosnowskyi]